MAIESILPQLYIGPYCKYTNLKVSDLQVKKPFLITSECVTNGMVYELEQYRQKEKLSIILLCSGQNVSFQQQLIKAQVLKLTIMHGKKCIIQ